MIKVRGLAAGTELFILSYPGEKSLREILAGSRIISSGFASASEAAESLKSRSLREKVVEQFTKCGAGLQRLCTD